MSGQSKAILPAKLNIGEMLAAMTSQADALGDEILATAENITSGWRGEKPTWGKEITATDNAIILTVAIRDPNSEGGRKFVFLDKGTQPHMIYPVNGSTLIFNAGYRAGSTPGSLTTTSAQSSGPKIFSKGVAHPGTEPREWLRGLIEKFTPRAVEALNEAIAAAVQASNHKINK